MPKPELTADDLIVFERGIADDFNDLRIRAPIHLSGGNEAQLIELFREVLPSDWVCSTWRSHYHCLLKGVPPKQLKADILAGRSITLTYPEYKIISSAIVGGIVPIALGIAWALKYEGARSKVWAFIGDMTARSGVLRECLEYACGHKLPIVFVIEDNGVSVCTDTLSVWGTPYDFSIQHLPYLQGYEYRLPWPHSGAGKRINF
jgi:TPP-dependent pyruvate/acetoin dehydrogenase alpha subunit